jgi:hypothetical protein
MTPQSAKDKGRRLQNWVAGKLLEYGKALEPDDVRSTSMGVTGEDVKLSPAARRQFPFQFECKNRATIAVYQDYKQCAKHGTHEPVLIIKQNNCKPLAIVDADWFLKKWSEQNDSGS